MGKKVALKAFVVYSPFDTRPRVFFGGVAGSASGEYADENRGFVIELKGEIDMDQFVSMYEELVADHKERIQLELRDPRYRTYLDPERQANHIKEQYELLQSAEKELELAREKAK